MSLPKTLLTAYPLAGRETKKDRWSNIIEAVEKYQVITQFNETQINVLGAANLPAPLAAHPDFPNLVVNAIDPKEDSNATRWIVTVTYKIALTSTSSYPGEQRVKIEYDTYEIMQDVIHDLRNSETILDGNGRPLEESFQAPISFPLIKITKKMSFINRAAILAKSGTINDADVTVAGVTVPYHQGKIHIRAIETNDPHFKWEVSFDIHIRHKIVTKFCYKFSAVGTPPTFAGPIDIGWDEAYVISGWFAEVGGVGMSRATEDVYSPSGAKIDTRPTARPVALDPFTAFPLQQQLDDGVQPFLRVFQSIESSDWSTLNLNVT